MSRHTRRSRLRQVRGFTLIEMMIAMTLGLVITAAIGYVFVSSKRSFSYSQGMARVQENSRAGIVILDTLIRQAGYIYDVPGGDMVPTAYTPSCNYKLNDPACVFVQTLNPTMAPIYGGSPTAQLANTIYGSNLTSNPSLDQAANTDFIQVAYFGDGAAGTGNNANITDCLGRNVAQNEMAINIFYVNKAAGETTTSLYCTARTWDYVKNQWSSNTEGTLQSAPIIYGVVGLQATYGIDCDDDGIVNYYTAAANIVTAAPGTMGNDPTCASTSPNWRQVKSVRLTLATQSTEAVGGSGIDAASTTGYSYSNTSGTHTMIGNGKAPGAGGQVYLERPLNQTIYIRNRLISYQP